MNATQAIQQNEVMINDLLTASKEIATRLKISVNEAIDKKVTFYEKNATTANSAVAWFLRGQEAKKLALNS